MHQAAIFGPFFATMFLTMAVWIYMYARRIPFILGSGMTPGELATPGRLAQISPPEVSNPSDNLKNLFEIPVLFYALALYLFVTSQVDGAYVVAAWVFVVFRVLHTIDPRAGYAIAYRGLASADPSARASGRELAENLLQGRLRTAVVALTDTLAPPARLAAAVEFHQPEGADELLALASDGAPDRGQLEALLDTLRTGLLDDPDLVLRTIAMHQLDGAVWPADAPARAGGAGV